jgi:NADH-quinone oxidoreductase subunit E
MDIKFTDENIKILEENIKRYPSKQAALLKALWLAQEQFGWISRDIMVYIGDYLGVAYEHVYGVANFYTMFNKKPTGKNHVQVCTNVSCMLRGGYDVLDYISKKLNIKAGGTTPDSMFSLSEVECLGSCGTAPMIQVNNDYYENLTKEKIDNILEGFSKK